MKKRDDLRKECFHLIIQRDITSNQLCKYLSWNWRYALVLLIEAFSCLLFYWEVSHANCTATWFVNCSATLRDCCALYATWCLFWALLGQNCYVIWNFCLKCLLDFVIRLASNHTQTLSKNILKKENLLIRECRKYSFHMPEAAW